MSSQKIASVGRLGVYLDESNPGYGQATPPSTLAYVTIDVPYDDADAYNKHWNPLGYKVAKHISAKLKEKGYVFEGSEHGSNLDPWKKCDMGQEIRYAGIVRARPEEDEDGIKTIEKNPNNLIPKLLADTRAAIADFKKTQGIGETGSDKAI